MPVVFNIVAGLLALISYITGLTYKEINIIVYYVVIPFIFVAQIDRIFKKDILKVVFAVGLITARFFIKDFNQFSEWLFERSVEFLDSFYVIGWDYITASVIICVVVPLIVFLLLRAQIKRSKHK